MKIRTIEIGGFAAVAAALHLPMNKEAVSKYETTRNQSGNCIEYGAKVEFVEKDLGLMRRLIKSGDDHAKVIRGLNVWVEIDAPLFFWSELETYRAGHERISSQSTMNRECKGLKGYELEKVKAAMPSGTMLKKVDMFSYQALKNIYYARKKHRLPIWRQFREWIETLPFATSLILGETPEDNGPSVEDIILNRI